MASAEKALIDENEKEQGVDFKGDISHLKDTRFSYFVCTCTFISQVFILGVLHAFGVFFVEFVKEFKSPKGEAAWIGSLAYGLSMLFGPVTSVLVSRFGYSRVMMVGGVICAVSLMASSFANSVLALFFTFSVLYGVGTSMCTSPTMTIIGEYFDKHLSVATGITVSGSSFGTLIMGPLSQLIIDHAGWRTAFRIFAGLSLLTVIMNSRIRPLVMPSGKAKGQKRNLLHDLQIWKNRVFVIWTVSIMLVMFGFYIPYVHLVSYAIDQGISPDRASILMMILGATTAFGRIMFGRIVQIGVLNRLHMHQLSMLITGTGVMILPIIKSYIGIIIYTVTVGLVDGCYVVLLPILTTSLVGIENSVLAWGFMIGTCSITFTLGPPVAGALYDATGSYNIAFHCAGIPIVGGALLLFFIPWAQRTSAPGAILHTLNEYTLQDCTELEIPDPRAAESIGTMCDSQSLAFSTCSRRTGVSVKTTGTSPMEPNTVDKSTSTDNVPLRYFSLDVEDTLSQLSQNDKMFTEMLRQSYDSSISSTGPPVSSDNSACSIPRIPPPSDPSRYKQGSSVHSHYSGTNIVRERPTSQSRTPSSIHMEAGSSCLSTTQHSLHSENQGTSQPISIENSQHSFSHDPLSAGNQIIFPVKYDTASVKSPSTQLSPSSFHNVSLTSQKVPSREISEFDQTISNQVSILRETLRSPVQVDSKISENIPSNVNSAELQSVSQQCFDSNTNIPNQRIDPQQDSFSDSMPQSIPSKLSSLAASLHAQSEPSASTQPPINIILDNKDVAPPSGASTQPTLNNASDNSVLTSGSTKSHTVYSTFTRPSSSTTDSDNISLNDNVIAPTSGSVLSGKTTATLSAIPDLVEAEGVDSRFATDNQITVIHGTNPFRDKQKDQSAETSQCTKLEDLFRPATITDMPQKSNESFELLETLSDEKVEHSKSHTGELDVFKHLFADEDTEHVDDSEINH